MCKRSMLEVVATMIGVRLKVRVAVVVTTREVMN